ncbi:MAG: OmpH family outer membrane protein [Deltaproteobacteria bacterium]|nr:OmpH family outer membrane protein [Deltaproteobacteria bacterium]
MSKKLFLGGMALLLLYPLVLLGQPKVKIGYVDMQRVLNEVEDGAIAKEKLKKEFNEKQAQLDRKQEELKRKKEDYDKQALVLKEDAKRQKQQELQQDFIELQQLYAKLQKELSENELGLTKEIFDKAQTVIADIAQREGFTLILDKAEGRILYALPSMDITNEVIRKYNEKYSGGKKR